MSKLLCNIEDFKSAVEKCENLLSEKNLSCRGIKKEDLSDEIKDKIRNLKNFLSWIAKQIDKGEVNSYVHLLKELQTNKAPSGTSDQIGFLGKILDAVQIVEINTLRSKRISKTIEENLARTGHKFLLGNNSKHLDKIKREYSKELLEATSTFHLLEVSFMQCKKDKSRNPIASLRKSAGNRLPEEYFSELLAGWLVEDAIKLALENKGFKVTLNGVDKERKILFYKPKDMSAYDLEVEGNFFMEVQRVGKLTISRKYEEKLNGKSINISLKKHKYNEGNSNNKILVLWIGKNAPNIKRKNKDLLENKLLFVINPKNRKEVVFNNKRIYISVNLISTGIPSSNISFQNQFKNYDKKVKVDLTWNEFKRQNKKELEEFLKNQQVR